MQALASDLPYRLGEMPACLPVPRRSALAAPPLEGIALVLRVQDLHEEPALTFRVEPLPAALGAGTCPFLASKRLEPEDPLPLPLPWLPPLGLDHRLALHPKPEVHGWRVAFLERPIQLTYRYTFDPSSTFHRPSVSLFPSMAA